MRTVQSRGAGILLSICGTHHLRQVRRACPLDAAAAGQRPRRARADVRRRCRCGVFGGLRRNHGGQRTGTGAGGDPCGLPRGPRCPDRLERSGRAALPSAGRCAHVSRDHRQLFHALVPRSGRLADVAQRRWRGGDDGHRSGVAAARFDGRHRRNTGIGHHSCRTGPGLAIDGPRSARAGRSVCGRGSGAACLTSMPDDHKFCAACGTALAPLELSCPQCHQLVYAEEMDALAQQAREKESTGDPQGASTLWRQVLALLPPESAQAASIRDRLASLSQGPGAAARIGSAGPQESFQQSRAKWTKRLGPLGVIIAFLLKFKTLVLVALTKAKFLLLGLAKLKTLLSMFAFFGVYWSLYGWAFALGFVLGIYVHEM